MTRYFKLSGGGNDFIAMVDPEAEPSPEQIRDWCRRGMSVGADGFFVLARTEAGEARMRYFNSDGYRADLCVNGTRCAIRLATALDWVQGDLVLVTDAGPVRGRALDAGRVALEISVPSEPREVVAEVGNARWHGWETSVGVPHFVLIWPEELGSAPVAELGPQLRSHTAFGDHGANIDFVRFPSPQSMEIRTFERGVEEETLACGSGVMAGIAAGIAAGVAELPIRALTLGGFALEVESSCTGQSRGWTLTGDARLVSKGTILDGATGLPDPPVWS